MGLKRPRVKTIGDATLYLGDCREISKAIATRDTHNGIGTRILRQQYPEWFEEN